jgi:hypothetical protein
MLGEQIGEARGQTIGIRVLPDEGNGPRMEVTDRSAGTLYGEHINTTVTYTGTMRPNGTIYGSGTGTVMADTGDTASFRGAGVGRIVRPGITTWRGRCSSRRSRPS